MYNKVKHTRKKYKLNRKVKRKLQRFIGRIYNVIECLIKLIGITSVGLILSLFFLGFEAEEVLKFFHPVSFIMVIVFYVGIASCVYPCIEKFDRDNREGN